MAKLTKPRTAQYPLVAEFTFNALDTIESTSGVDGSFNDALVADVIPLPVGAVVTGGSIAVETVYGTTGAATVSVGDSGSTTRYAATKNVKALGVTALTPTGYRYTAASNLRLTVATADVAAGNAGKVTLRVEYVIENRANENNI